MVWIQNLSIIIFAKCLLSFTKDTNRDVLPYVHQLVYPLVILKCSPFSSSSALAPWLMRIALSTIWGVNGIPHCWWYFSEDGLCMCQGCFLLMFSFPRMLGLKGYHENGTFSNFPPLSLFPSSIAESPGPTKSLLSSPLCSFLLTYFPVTLHPNQKRINNHHQLLATHLHRYNTEASGTVQLCIVVSLTWFFAFHGSVTLGYLH